MMTQYRFVVVVVEVVVVVVLRSATAAERAFECDDVISRAHVSRKQERQAAASRGHGWYNPSVSSSRFPARKGFPNFTLASDRFTRVRSVSLVLGLYAAPPPTVTWYANQTNNPPFTPYTFVASTFNGVPPNGCPLRSVVLPVAAGQNAGSSSPSTSGFVFRGWWLTVATSHGAAWLPSPAALSSATHSGCVGVAGVMDWCEVTSPK